MRLFLTRLLLAIILLYAPYRSMAWGMLGHRIVGEIADSHLTPSARKQVQQILGTESIAIASNWADFIKSDTSYKYLNSWHYVDPEGVEGYGQMQSYLQKDTAANAYTRLNFMIRELKNKQLSPEKKLFYLRMLIHIVGDIHQPLHVSRRGDRGGNDIKVKWLNEPTNLHSVWDEKLIDFQQLSYTEYTKAINHTTLAQRTAWKKLSPEEWMYESYRISDSLRTDVKPDDNLGYNYNFKHIQTLNGQLLKGGVRLAGLLNMIFGS